MYFQKYLLVKKHYYNLLIQFQTSVTPHQSLLYSHTVSNGL